VVCADDVGGFEQAIRDLFGEHFRYLP
jgi:hypothetical protein